MFLFRAICIASTGALSAFWLYKYTLNEDLSVFEYKQFYKTEDDVFPVLSLCFRNPFLTEKLRQNHGINELTYLSFLQGKNLTTKMLEIDYDKITLELTDYLTQYTISYRNNSHQSFQSEEDTRKSFEKVLVDFGDKNFTNALPCIYQTTKI